MKNKLSFIPLTLIIFCLCSPQLKAQKKGFAFHLGYHYNPDDFYLSPAELDSSFTVEQGLRFGARFKYLGFFNESARWAWHLQLEYSHRSIPYRFQTRDTDDEKFNGELEGRYLDVGLGVDNRYDINENIRVGWSATAAVGIPFQSDTLTAELPPYPLRRATNYLPYLGINLVAERIFSRGEKGHWLVGIEPVLRLYTSPLHKQEADQGIYLSPGFNFGITYVIY